VRRALAAAVLLAWALAAAAPATVVAAGGTSSPRAAGVPRLITATLSAINDIRRSHGLAELRLNRALSSTALGHSASMARHGYFSHDSHDGSEFWTRIKSSYPPRAGFLWRVGENMAWASPALSAQQTIDMWLKSPTHRTNLLGAAWREVGIGAVHADAAPGAYQGLEVTILTVDFGVR
jgi:uncharacterized protein YkwD